MTNEFRKMFETFKKCLSELDFWINQGVVFSKEEIDELMDIKNNLEKQTDTIITFQNRLEELKNKN
jgi:hypothetical protein